MAQIDNKDLSIFKDAVNGAHDFTAGQLEGIHAIAHELSRILEASKKKEQERIAKAGH